MIDKTTHIFFVSPATPGVQLPFSAAWRVPMGGWVYIMANRYRGTIYIGVTADISRRAFQHATGEGADFCKKYDLTQLVYADYTERIEDAIAREKAMKKWRRDWKVALIERANPDWLDLFDTLNGAPEE